MACMFKLKQCLLSEKDALIALLKFIGVQNVLCDTMFLCAIKEPLY